MKVFVVKRKSAKTGKEFVAIIGRKGDREYYLSFDRATAMKIANLTFDDCYNMAVGEEIAI